MDKKSKQAKNIKRVTIIFAWVLFLLLFVAVTVSTIVPMVGLIVQPQARHINVASLLISLIAGAILPPLISYYLGYRVTREKSKMDRHFNGALFGFASHWVSLFFLFIESGMLLGIRSHFAEPLASIVASWPVVAVAIIMGALAAGISKKRGKVDVVGYGPFRVVLFVSVVANLGYMIVNTVQSGSSSWILALMSLLSIVVLILIIAGVYALLPAAIYRERASRLAFAIIAVTVAVAASSVAGQLISYTVGGMWLPPSVGVVVLGIFMYLIRIQGTKNTA